ncbi:MAG: hypothetical protein M3Y64_09675, partial [Gemmatimonadota bacterium]|nr:hypothetical protein [Gemmatimonadota bacterium]
MSHTPVRRSALRHAIFIASTVLAVGPANAYGQAAAHAVSERKPTVAVMEFDNAAMIKRDEFAALTSGFQVMLTNAIATNPSIEVVERQKLQHL